MFDFIFIGNKTRGTFSGSHQKGRLLAFHHSLRFYSMSGTTAVLATERDTLCRGRLSVQDECG